MPPAMAPAGGPYRALLKHALRPRQQRILLLCALATHILTCAALGAPLALVRASTLVGTAAILALVLLPLLLERRHRLIYAPDVPAAPTPAVTRGAHWLDLLRCAPAWTRAGRQAGAAALFAVLSRASRRTHGTGATLAPATYVASHGAHYVNETFLVLVYLAACAGALLAWSDARHTPRACWNVPPFDPDAALHPVSLRVRTLRTLGVRVPRALALLPWLAAPYGTYLATRDAFWSAVLRVVGVDTVVRPYVVPSFRPAFRPGHMLLAVLPPLALVLVLFALAHTLFDVYWTHPLPAAPARDPNATLLAGLHDPHPFFAAHAYSELVRIAMYDAPRRAVLFADVQRLHGRPVAWHAVATACIQRLDAFLAEPRAAPAPPAPPARTDAPRAPDAPREAAPSIWTALAQGPRPAPAAPRAAPAAPAAATPSAGPTLYNVLRIAVYAVRAALARVLRAVPSDAKHALVPQALHLAFTAPSPTLVLDAELLAPRAVVCWAALGLEHLVAASLTEDAYGSVQKDVARVVRALLRAHERLQGVQQRVERAALDADHQLVREARVVRGALREVGADAATFSTTYAPFFHELQTTWQAHYAGLDAALAHSAQQIVQTFAPYGIET
ncbi:hypothetical protein MOBT1_002376 [Malassezia obtusa]|uniref:Nucleoporin protein Ndc1-Nup n=1 Tax=Malassezia obtusa TaxID=76774 RepID=A0AAF0E210_9BASI|nr:hypothetical protein MOBT1_002376 [Malassezia obtusa]